MNKPKKQIRVRETRSDRIIRVAIYAILAVVLVAYIYPLYFVVIASFSDPNAIYNGEVLLLPKQVTVEGYEEILRYKELWIGYLNSIYYTVGGTMINIVVTMMTAYALSRREFMIRGVLMKLFMFTMFFSGGMIPQFLLLKDLNLLNTRIVLWLTSILSVQNLLITRTFLVSSIPEELHEAANIDGCSEIRYLISIVVPLSGAVIGVNALYYGTTHWNAYFGAMIWITDRDKFPLQLFLREILNATSSSSMFEAAGTEAEKARQMRVAEVIKYCSIIVASVPMLILYPFVQKFFVKGVMIGSVKG